VNKGETESDISSDLTVTTEHHENFVGKYPLPLSRDGAKMLLANACESSFVQYQDRGVRDIDQVVVKRAGARKRRPIAARRQHYIGLTQERAKRSVDRLPKLGLSSGLQGGGCDNERAAR
jgi:hypothetical protein